MTRYRLDYVIFQLPEPNDTAAGYSVLIGHDEYNNIYYILDDEANAQKVADIVPTRPQRVRQRYVNYWAYQNNVKLED